MANTLSVSAAKRFYMKYVQWNETLSGLRTFEIVQICLFFLLQRHVQPKYPETLSQFSVTKNNLVIQCGKLIRCVVTWCRTLHAVNSGLEKMGYQADTAMACLKVTACACLQSLRSTHATICFGLQRLPHWRAFGRPLLSQQSHSRKTIFLWLVVVLTNSIVQKPEVKPNPETAPQRFTTVQPNQGYLCLRGYFSKQYTGCTSKYSVS